MRKPTSLLTLSILTLGIGACSSDPPSPSSVRSKITSDLGHVLTETAAATDGATSMMPTGTFDLLEKFVGQGGSTAAANLLAPSDPADEEGVFDPDAIIEQLNTTIFTNENEVAPGIYAVPASLACESTDFDANGNEITTLDPDCVDSWNKLALRIRVEDDSNGLTFAIQVGAGHDEPLEIALTHTSVSLSVDLDEAEDATKAIAQAFGEQAPNAELSGKFTGTLTVLGAANVGLQLDIDRAIDIAVAEQGQSLSGPEAFRLTSAQAVPVLALLLNGVAQTAGLTVNLGETALHIPGEDGFDLDLPAVKLFTLATAGQPIKIEGISLGNRTTTVSKGGQVGLAIDLNPQDGRKFDATITSAATGETLSVSPKLDARIMTNHTVLGDEMGVYDVTRVLLDGSLHSSDASDQLKVLTGTFSISTNPAQYGFSATAGQCVAGEETFDATTDDFYTAWTVGVCN
ncbi:MAG: hypothetical protein H0T46_26450 [Deltaproteobacteria bacterium]|nr:hypothetical protein [Deltaproteobacteria bacterium]